MPKNDDGDRVHLGGDAMFDKDLLGGSAPKSGAGYVASIEAGIDNDDDEDEMDTGALPQLSSRQVNAPAALLNKFRTKEADNFDPFADTRVDKSIASRENEYRQRGRLKARQISPDRVDPMGAETPDVRHQTYASIMQQQNVTQELTMAKREINRKIERGEAKASDFGPAPGTAPKRRVDLSISNGSETPSTTPRKKMSLGVGSISAVTPRAPTGWEETPGRPAGDATPNPNATPRIWDATPAHVSGGTTPGTGTTPSAKRNRWDETPKASMQGSETPGWGTTPRVDRGGEESSSSSSRVKKSRWDMTPANEDTPGMTPTAGTPSMTPGMTPSGAGGETPGATPRDKSMMTPRGGETPSGMTPNMGMTPGGTTPVGMNAMGMQTPAPGQGKRFTSQEKMTHGWQVEIDERNRPLSDEEIDAMLPPGYKVLDPPAGYQPVRTPSRKITATPTPMANGKQSGFFMQEEKEMSSKMKGQELQTADQDLPMLKPDDMQYFDKLLIDVDENALTTEEVKERRIMKLLLKIKNGTPPMRKSALRQITDRAREFGAGPLLNQILPLLMSPTLEDQERHLLVKVIDRILYKLDDLVRPYVHKILVVIEPLLIDEDYYARVEGREIISNLAKAAGLATMISTMRPDIDNIDEYVRNTTARAFSQGI